MFFLLFVVLPLVELLLLTRVSGVIGFNATVLLVIATGLVGGKLARSQGRKAWQKVQEALANGRIPTGEGLDAVLVLVAGILLVTPGVLTDGLGVLLLLPPFRALLKPTLMDWLKRKVRVVPGGTGTGRPGSNHPGSGDSGERTGAASYSSTSGGAERGAYDPFRARERGRVVDVE